MKTTISDIFFDLDHTLWDFEKNSALAFESIFNRNDMKINLAEFLSNYIPINIKYWEWYRKDLVSQSELRLGRLRQTFENMGLAINDEQLLLLSDEYIHHLPKYNHLFDGAISILEYLNSKYNLHIITNGFNSIQENKLVNSNIRHFFKTVTNSEIAGVKKPNPIIYQFALDAANAKKETSLMIGDCIEADVLGAMNCGWDAILFNECNVAVSKDVKQINHLLELKNYL